MTKVQVSRFFANFGLTEGKDSKPFSLPRYTLIVTTAARWHGEMFAQIVADCFMPHGESIEPGYEDSLEWHQFEWPSEAAKCSCKVIRAQCQYHKDRQVF
jgi:hypothetical protein